MATAPGPRYTTEIPMPTEPGMADYFVAGLQDKRKLDADNDKQMATLIAQLAQVGMIKPGGSKGDEGTLSAYGQTYTVIDKPEDIGEQRTRQIINQARKESGELPMSDYEITMQARDAALKLFNDPNWQLREMQVRQEIDSDDPAVIERAIQEEKGRVFQEQYNTLRRIQEQYFPDHYKKNPASPVPVTDVNGQPNPNAKAKKGEDISNAGLFRKFINVLTAPEAGVDIKPNRARPIHLSPTATAADAATTGTPTATGKPAWLQDAVGVGKLGGLAAGSAGALGFGTGFMDPGLLARYASLGGTNPMKLGAQGAGALARTQGLPMLANAGRAGMQMAGRGLAALPNALPVGLAAAAGWGAGRMLGKYAGVDKAAQDFLLNKTNMYNTQAEPVNPYYTQGQ